MALLCFLPTVYTLTRLIAARANGSAVGDPGTLSRLIVLTLSTAFFLWLVRFRPSWGFLRDVMPFLFCAIFYANLHDLMVFYRTRDITPDLYKWDVRLFGLEPTIWAQRFIHPFLTDYFTVCYWSFYVCGPFLGLLLYLKKDWRPFRYTMVSLVFCLYLGYVGYVAWPASAPRLAIPEAYSVPLQGGSTFLDYTRAATAAVPLTAYGAFPSLHCAIALLALLLAWKHLRWFFWAQLPLCVGLIVGTVYLRHHWVVDILAGFVLTFLALWLGPIMEDAWLRMGERAVGAEESAAALPVTAVVERDGADRAGHRAGV